MYNVECILVHMYIPELYWILYISGDRYGLYKGDVLCGPRGPAGAPHLPGVPGPHVLLEAGGDRPRGVQGPSS